MQIFEQGDDPSAHVGQLHSSELPTQKQSDQVNAKPYRKPNPFEKIQKEKEMQLQKSALERSEKEQRYQEGLAKKEALLQKRNKDRKFMMQRTKKGQPVMKNVLHNLLNKIKSK